MDPFLQSKVSTPPVAPQQWDQAQSTGHPNQRSLPPIRDVSGVDILYWHLPPGSTVHYPSSHSHLLGQHGRSTATYSNDGSGFTQVPQGPFTMDPSQGGGGVATRVLIQDSSRNEVIYASTKKKANDAMYARGATNLGALSVSKQLGEQQTQWKVLTTLINNGSYSARYIGDLEFAPIQSARQSDQWIPMQNE